MLKGADHAGVDHATDGLDRLDDLGPVEFHQQVHGDLVAFFLFVELLDDGVLEDKPEEEDCRRRGRRRGEVGGTVVVGEGAGEGEGEGDLLRPLAALDAAEFHELDELRVLGHLLEEHGASGLATTPDEEVDEETGDNGEDEDCRRAGNREREEGG